MTEPTSLRVQSSQNVSLSTSSAPSAAIGSSGANDWETEVVRLVADVDCWIAFGASPTASADASGNSIFLPAGTVEYFDIPPGQKVAGIVASGTGTLSAARMR